ncbi:MAG: nucleoside deaminase [Acidimicrobiia bacterium]
MEYAEAMLLALSEAVQAPEHGDVPIGAVIIGPDGTVVSSDHNRTVERSDPTAHAELLAIRLAAEAIGDWRLNGHTLVVTLEPCPMCAGAAVWARLDRIVYGAADPKAGAAWSLYNIPQDARLNHRCELEAGVMADESARLLNDFFSSRR